MRKASSPLPPAAGPPPGLRRPRLRRGLLLLAALGLLGQASLARGQGLQEALQGLGTDMAQKLAAQGALTVAVADFPALQGAICDLGRFVAERLTNQLAGAQVNGKPVARMLDRGLLAQALGEMALTPLDLADPEHARQVGLRVGAEALVLGALSDLGPTLEVDVRLVRLAGGETLYTGYAAFAKTQPLDGMQRQGCTAGAAGPPAPGSAPGAAADGFIPQQARYENDAYRLRFESARRADNTLTLVVVADNLTDRPFRLALRGFSYLLDEHGERWDQDSADTAGYWSWGRRFDLVDLVPGTRRRTRLVFKPQGESNGTRFTLVAREYLPQDGRYVTVPDLLVPLVPGGPVAPPSQPARAAFAPLAAPAQNPAPAPVPAPGARRAPAPSRPAGAPAASPRAQAVAPAAGNTPAGGTSGAAPSTPSGVAQPAAPPAIPGTGQAPAAGAPNGPPPAPVGAAPPEAQPAARP